MVADGPVLVTGGAGFIGSHLVGALLEAGARVRVLDDFSCGRRENLAALERFAGSLEVVAGDVRDRAAVAGAVAGARVVFHLAALGSVPRSVAEPLATHEVNATGSLHVFVEAAAAGAARVVLASSSSVYGDSRAARKSEETLGAPLSPYAASKRAMELYAEALSGLGATEFVALRFFNVYGPRQDPRSAYAAVVPRFFSAALSGRRPVVYGDGEQSRDFTYVGDVVRACLGAAAAPLPAGRFVVANAACGGSTSVNALWQAVARATGSTAEPEHVPERKGDIRDSCASPERLRSWLGWAPATPLSEGIVATAPYYRELLAAP